VDQIISIYAGTQGFFDKVPVAKVRAAEKAVIRAIRDSHQELWSAIDKTKVIDGETETKFRKVVTDVINGFLSGTSYDPR
jgi:F-type H+-transporting ATPase subunit alpha